MSIRLYSDDVSNAQILQNVIRWEDVQEWYESDGRQMTCFKNLPQHPLG